MCTYARFTDGFAYPFFATRKKGSVRPNPSIGAHLGVAYTQEGFVQVCTTLCGDLLRKCVPAPLERNGKKKQTCVGPRWENVERTDAHGNAKLRFAGAGLHTGGQPRAGESQKHEKCPQNEAKVEICH